MNKQFFTTQSQSIIASVICIITAVAVVIALGTNSTVTEVVIFGVASLLLISGLFFFLWPAIRRQDLEAVETLPGALEEVRKLGREYYRNTSAIQENSATVTRLNEELIRQVEGLLPLRKPLEELLFQQRQEVMNLTAELDSWRKSIIQHFEYLDRSINLDGIDELLQATYKKTFDDLARELRPLGFEVIKPKPGDSFDEHFHEWKREVDSDLPPEHIVSAEGLGFCIGGRCIKHAPVSVSRRKAPHVEIEEPRTETEHIQPESEPIPAVSPSQG